MKNKSRLLSTSLILVSNRVRLGGREVKDALFSTPTKNNISLLYTQYEQGAHVMEEHTSLGRLLFDLCITTLLRDV